MNTENPNTNYITTDMAVERVPDLESDVTVEESTVNGFHLHKLTVLRPCHGIAEAGEYVTLTLGKPWLASRERTEQAAEALAETVYRLCSAAIRNKARINSALVVCLGNRKITADAIGPLCAEGIVATRHLEREKAEIWRDLGSFNLSVLTAGVAGETGIEAYELTKAAVNTAKPQVVITVDALSARDTARLGTSIQITDTGIAPGSGIGNRRMAISQKTVGVPVISVGVPTVAHSATLIRDALNKSETNLSDKQIETALSVGRDFFVTPRDCDIAVASMADIISRAVNLAFLGFQRL